MDKDRIFLGIVIAFLFGVFSGSFFHLPSQALLCLGLAFSLALFILLPPRVVCAGLFFLFAWYGGDVLASEQKNFAETRPVLAETVRGEVRIVSDPENRDFYRRTLLHFERCDEGHCPIGRILWQAPLLTPFPSGTRLAFACTLTLPERFTPEFNYPMFLAKDRIFYICERSSEATVLPQDTEGRLRALLYAPKHAFEQALSQVLSEPEAGLAKGLFLGGDHYLPKALKESFTRIGLSHMIAVSGYNITLIAEMMLLVGLFAGLWRSQAIWVALVGILFFIVMIGMPASAARAGAMASIVFLALQSGRLTEPANALLFAGATMLLFDPLLLRYDLGFQLSFLATLAILLLVPYYTFIAPKNVIFNKIGEVLYITVAVEIFVLPLILFSFHTFSPLIIIGNFLILLVPFAMASAFATACLFFILPGSHLPFSFLAFGILVLMTRSVEWLGSLQGMSIDVLHFRVIHLVSWYSVLVGILVLLHKFLPEKRYEKLV